MLEFNTHENRALIRAKSLLLKRQAEVSRWEAHSAADIAKKRAEKAKIDKNLRHIDSVLERVPLIRKPK